jgi:hypothetical protein
VCAIFNYGLNKLPGTPPFDPRDKQKASESTLGSIKWNVQNYAYQINNTIDDFLVSYVDINNPTSKVELYGLIQNVNNTISSARGLLYSEPLLNAYPEMNLINNFLNLHIVLNRIHFFN